MQNKSVAIVTGASQGIGRATPIRLAREFEAVIPTARQEDEHRRYGVNRTRLLDLAS
jgi:3-oxoacyl-[acyl-carrier protein] reductase